MLTSLEGLVPRFEFVCFALDLVHTLQEGCIGASQPRRGEEWGPRREGGSCSPRRPSCLLVMLLQGDLYEGSESNTRPGGAVRTLRVAPLLGCRRVRSSRCR